MLVKAILHLLEPNSIAIFAAYAIIKKPIAINNNPIPNLNGNLGQAFFSKKNPKIRHKGR